MSLYKSYREVVFFTDTTLRTYCLPEFLTKLPTYALITSITVTLSQI